MSGPWLLDLFCGAGGAAVGYAKAGFQVVGVDIAAQPRWPRHIEGIGDFYQEDALDYLARRGRDFDLIHASPPCQRWSTMTQRHGSPDHHPDYIGPVRELLTKIGKPYVIENVPRAPLVDPVVLCGTMFGLGTYVDGEFWELRRHRIFESNVLDLEHPRSCAHQHRTVGVYGNSGGKSNRDGIRFASTRHWKEAMGIDWMVGRELKESIPPAYTQWIGLQYGP